MAYCDSRSVQDRLDAVFGGEWGTRFEETVGGMRCYIVVRGVQRGDAGEPGDTEMAKGPKAQHSDAFKRAAVMWGVGRFLYSLPSVWVPYDAQRKKITDAGMADLTMRYQRWAARPEVVKLWGEPLGHADVAEAAPVDALPPEDQAVIDNAADPLGLGYS
jgi:hypothetical protein